MIQINLLPAEFRKKESVKLVLPEIPIQKTLTIGLGVFFGAQILISAFAGYEKLELGFLRKEVASLDAELKTVTARKAETAFLERRLKEAGGVAKRKFAWSSLLNELSASTTKGVWLRDFSVQEGQESQVVKKKEGKNAAAAKVRYLKLEGSAIGPGQEMAFIGKFLKSLKENARLSALFGEIEVSSINQRKIKEYDVADFTMIFVFKKDKF